MLKDCYYSDSDKTLFYIAGYTQADNTDNLEDIIKSLALHKDNFIKEFSLSDVNIKTRFIERSCRYKNMRVFYVTNIDFNEAWLDTYRIEGDDWSMSKWLEY